MKSFIRSNTKQHLTLNLFLIDFVLSLYLALCSFIFVLLFGIFVAIVDNYSTAILKWLFIILPICTIVVFIGTLCSFITQEHL